MSMAKAATVAQKMPCATDPTRRARNSASRDGDMSAIAFDAAMTSINPIRRALRGTRPTSVGARRPLRAPNQA